METAGLTKVKEVIQERKASCPKWVQELLEKAQREYLGMHILPGTESKPFFVGEPPRWKEQAVTDKEYVWCLNRMYHWNNFILAYYLTNELRYALKIKEELLNWIEECPPPEITSDWNQIREGFDSVTPWRTLEAGIRMFEVWPNTLRFLTAEKLLDEKELERIVYSVRQHGAVLRNIPPRLWPDANHNHYLMENLGLLCLCQMFPELDSASEWSAHANEQIVRCAEKQISAGGAQTEGCPTYHNLCMEFFCRWLILCEELKLPVDERLIRKIEKGLDYSMASFRPCGGCVPWGDSDSDFGVVKAVILSYRAFHTTKWIRCLERMLGSERLKEEWLLYPFEAEGVTFSQLPQAEEAAAQIPRFSFQKQINQVSYRSSWERDAFHLQFGCQMPGDNGHAHIDPLSFDFTALGKALIVDAGRFTYDEANDRQLFKSGAMHNCLLLDHRDPYDYVSSWRFGPQHDGCILRAEAAEGTFWAQGVHTCYFPAIHRRLVSMVENQFLIIWDKISQLEGKHAVSIYFNVDSTRVLSGASPGEYHTNHLEDANLYLCSLSGLTGKLLSGYTSQLIDVRRPSTRICYEDTDVTGSREYITVAVPFIGECPPIRHGEPFCDGKDTCMEVTVNDKGYRLRWNGERFQTERIEDKDRN